MKIVSLTATAAVLLGSGVAVAQLPPNSPSRNPQQRQAPAAPLLFVNIDSDKDGRVSRDEARAQGELTSSFVTLDADRDSYLTQAEFSKWTGLIPGASGSAGPGLSSPQPPTDTASASSPQNATDNAPASSLPETATDKDRGTSSPETAKDVQ